VQVDPINPTLKAPGIMLLKVKYGKPLSKFGFKFNLRRNTLDPEHPTRDVEERDTGTAGSGGSETLESVMDRETPHSVAAMEARIDVANFLVDRLYASTYVRTSTRAGAYTRSHDGST